MNVLIIFDLGSLLLNIKGFFMNMFKATIKAINANTYLSSFALKNFPENPPKRAPKNIPNPHFFNTSISIDPLLWCALAEAIEVGIIVIKDEPMAICINISSGKFKEVNIQNKIGTITIPPPTPNKPAINPATIPVLIRPAK